MEKNKTNVRLESLKKMLLEVLEDSGFKELWEITQDEVIDTLRENYEDDFIDEKIIKNLDICPNCKSDISVIYYPAKWEDIEPNSEYYFCENCKYKREK